MRILCTSALPSEDYQHAGRRTRAYPRAVWHGCGLACIGRHPERGAAPRAAERGRKGSQRRGDIAAATLSQIRPGKAVGASLRMCVPCQVKVKDQTIKSIIEDMVSHANGHISGCLGTYGVLVSTTHSEPRHELRLPQLPSRQSRCRCGRGESSPGADVAAVSPVPVQMWQGWPIAIAEV
jgi:hypothetical protein